MKAAKDLYYHNPRFDMIKFIPPTAKKMLDVGCFSGAFGELVKKEMDMEIWGVEPDDEAAKKASLFLDKVFCGLFDETLSLPEHYFDVIVMNDVLEHMIDPWSAINLAKSKLKTDGALIISLPNLRHIDNLMHIIIEKDFKYENTGIRDNTHVRFFTKKSAVRLIESCQLKCEIIEGVNEKWYTRSLFRRIAYRIFSNSLEDTKFIQYAFVCRKFT